MGTLTKGRLKTISLFSGAGGLDVGLGQVGLYDLLACVEIDPQFCQTLELNRNAGLFGSPGTQILCQDITVLNPYVLMDALGLQSGDLDVLVGGPPCQSFSMAGRRRTVEDPRGLLLWDFLRFVDALKPKYFLMENVGGLLSAAMRPRGRACRPGNGFPLAEEEMPGSVVKAWVADLAKIESVAYRVDLFQVNAVNYGAPQLRERVLMIGNRRSQVLSFPEPTHGPTSRYLDHRPFATLGDALNGFVESQPVLMDFSPRKKGYLRQVPPGGNWRMLPEDVARESMGRAYFAKGGRSGWWRRLSWDLPCPTITTMPNHSSTSMCHPDEVRALSVGECARIQEFPAGWSFCGSPQQQMKQVGNAVPSRLGKVAGELIVRANRGECSDSDEKAPQYRQIYLSSHVRTRQWWKNGQAFTWDGADSAKYSANRIFRQQSLF